MDREVEISALIEDLGSLDSEERRRAALQLEVHGQAALHPLIDAMQSTNPVLRMQAQRLIVRIVQLNDLQNPSDSAPDTEPIPETVVALVAALSSPSISYREQVEERLFSQRTEAIPALIHALLSASPIHASRIGQMLARLQAVESIPVLVARLSLREFPPEIAVVNAFDELLVLLPMEWRTLGLGPILVLLQGNTVPHVRTAQLEDAIALTLIRIAREEPVPQLRSALPYLKRPWYRRSMTLDMACRFIDKATRQWKDLPLPAQNSEESSSLPRPAEPTENPSTDLPNPAERG